MKSNNEVGRWFIKSAMCKSMLALGVWISVMNTAVAMKVAGTDVVVGETTLEEIEEDYKVDDDLEYSITGDTGRRINGKENNIPNTGFIRFFFNDENIVTGAAALIKKDQIPVLESEFGEKYKKPEGDMPTPMIKRRNVNVFLKDNVHVITATDDRFYGAILFYRTREFTRKAYAEMRKRERENQ